MQHDPIDILLVDDQPAKLLTYQAILEELGENLLTATTATAALERLLAGDVGVILMDVCMPELDGFQLVDMIRKHPRFEKTAVLFVSGVQLSDVDRIRGYAAGGVDYVTVPIVPEILRAKVRVFVELVRKTRQLERLNRELEERIAARTADLETSKARLEEARRKDEFLATLSHELRNPLAPVLNGARMLRRGGLDEAARDRIHRVIERQATHLVRIVDDLLDLSRISRGVVTLRVEPVDVAALVRDTVEAHLSRAGRRQVTVSCAGEAWVSGEAVRLAQIVANLLDNATKFTREDGRIDVSVATDAERVTIRVRDDGLGLSAEDLGRVFEPFVQVDSGRGGLGIGLALVRRLVDLHGGRVWAESPGRGGGATIAIELPRLPPPAQAGAAVAPAADRAPLRVLVVDDNADAADTLADLLHGGGHLVRAVYSGEAAVDAARDLEPDVVLLDLGMPHPDGFETARRLRSTPWGRRARLVALTGWAQPGDRRRTEEAGFDGHLVKPLEPHQLELVLGRPSPRSRS